MNVQIKILCMHDLKAIKIIFSYIFFNNFGYLILKINFNIYRKPNNIRKKYI